MRRSTSAIAVLLVAGVLVAIGLVSESQHLLTLTIQTMVLASLASSWNILGGFAGQISLGHAAFFGLGALVTRELWLGGTALVLAVAAAVAVTAAAAAIVGVPMLRFRDIYFAIGTLALGVAVFITAGNLWPGISSLPAEALRDYDFTGPYFMALAVLLATVAVSLWRRLRVERSIAWAAFRAAVQLLAFLVFDSEVLDRILHRIEGRCGELVGECEDGSQVVEASARLKPDIVLMDLSMPVMNGLDFLTALRHETGGDRNDSDSLVTCVDDARLECVGGARSRLCVVTTEVHHPLQQTRAEQVIESCQSTMTDDTS